MTEGSPADLQRMFGNQAVLSQFTLGTGPAGPPSGVGNQAMLAWLATNRTGSENAPTGDLIAAAEGEPQEEAATPLNQLELASGVDLSEATVVPDGVDPLEEILEIPSPLEPSTELASKELEPIDLESFRPKKPTFKVSADESGLDFPEISYQAGKELVENGQKFQEIHEIYNEVLDATEDLPDPFKQVNAAIVGVGLENKEKKEKHEESKKKVKNLATLLKGYDRDFGHSFKRSIDLPVGMGIIVNLGMNAAVGISINIGPDYDVGALINDAAASAHLGWKAEVTASASIGVSVALGAGLPGLNAGVRGAVSGVLSAAASVSVQARGSLQEEVKVAPGSEETKQVDRLVAEAAIGLDASLVVQGELGPYLKLGPADFDWMIPLMSYNIASWEPTICASISTDAGIEKPHLEDEDSLTLNLPEPGIEVAQAIADRMTSDNQAHHTVAALQEAGALSRITSAERATLLTALQDGVVLDKHEGSMLALIAAEPDVTSRWAMLEQAYRDAHGEDGDHDAILDWLDGAIDNDLFGEGANHDQLLELLNADHPRGMA